MFVGRNATDKEVEKMETQMLDPDVPDEKSRRRSDSIKYLAETINIVTGESIIAGNTICRLS